MVRTIKTKQGILSDQDLSLVKDKVLQGQLIAYPTEAVYGLGCDPFQLSAVEKLCRLKQRSMRKGLILIASQWSQVLPLIDQQALVYFPKAEKTWPGPVTWVFPASDKVPAWIQGEHHSIALRISDHLLCRQLCDALQQPLVSTSANLTGQAPVKKWQDFSDDLLSQLAFVIIGELGGLEQPTSIHNILTDDILRK